ncbi:MAG: hypothetical protein ACRDQ0_21715, partial [Pseudonocardia sp.]
PSAAAVPGPAAKVGLAQTPATRQLIAESPEAYKARMLPFSTMTEEMVVQSWKDWKNSIGSALGDEAAREKFGRRWHNNPFSTAASLALPLQILLPGPKIAAGFKVSSLRGKATTYRKMAGGLPDGSARGTGLIAKAEALESRASKWDSRLARPLSVGLRVANAPASVVGLPVRVAAGVAHPTLSLGSRLLHRAGYSAPGKAGKALGGTADFLGRGAESARMIWRHGAFGAMGVHGAYRAVGKHEGASHSKLDAAYKSRKQKLEKRGRFSGVDMLDPVRRARLDRLEKAMRTIEAHRAARGARAIEKDVALAATGLRELSRKADERLQPALEAHRAALEARYTAAGAAAKAQDALREGKPLLDEDLAALDRLDERQQALDKAREDLIATKKEYNQAITREAENAAMAGEARIRAAAAAARAARNGTDADSAPAKGKANVGEADGVEADTVAAETTPTGSSRPAGAVVPDPAPPLIYRIDAATRAHDGQPLRLDELAYRVRATPEEVRQAIDDAGAHGGPPTHGQV